MTDKKTTSKTRPLLAIIGVNFLWGMDFIAIEYMMDYMSPAVFTLLRLVIGSIVLIVICLTKRGGTRIKKNDIPRIFLAGSVGMAIYFSLENLGTGMTSASFSSLMMATVPIFGMLADRMFYGNRITPLKVICIIISIVGVWLLVRGEPMGINPIGLIAMLVAAILWTFYIVYTKSLFEKYDLLTLLTGFFISGLITQIPIAGISQAIFHTPVTFTTVGVIITIATAIVCIIIGEFGYVYAIGKLSPTTTAAFENVLPVTAVIFSFIIFGAMLSGLQIVGALMILIAVTVIALVDN